MKAYNLRSVAIAAVLTASSVVLSACGPNNRSYNGAQFANQVPTSTTQTSSSGSTMAQRCSSMPNVVGSGFSASVDREYRVCKGSVIGSPATSIALFPEDAATKQVCVFPVQVAYGQTAVYVVNPYAAPINRYAVQCGVISGTGSILNFSSLTNMNGAYLVNYADAGNFAQCLATGNVTACAANYGIGYSVGYWQ